MDDESVRSATRSELNTFQVLANTEFADLKKPAPLSWGGAVPQKDDKIDEAYDDAPREEPARYRSVSPSVQSQKSHRSRAPSVHSVAHSIKSVHTEVSEIIKPQAPHEYSERAKEEAKIDVAIEKESLLYELEMMEKQGSIKLHRQLTMADSLEAIQYQYDRANMIVSTQQTVEWAKAGIKMGSGLLETVVKKFGLTVVDGFSNNLCKDMNKFNQPLTKMYRKYWRRGSSSPESELAMIVFGALAMTVMGNKGIMGGPKAEPFARPQVPSAPPVAPHLPEQESALRPPGYRPVAAAPAKIPDWAKAALSADVAEKSKHFAQTVQAVQQPQFHQAQPAQQPALQPAQRQDVQPSTEPQIAELAMPVPTTFLPRIEKNEDTSDSTRKLTILASPRTGRRRKDVAEDLVFD